MNCFNFFYFFIFLSVVLSTDTHDFKHTPKMVVFDLDYTLWPFWVDVDVIPPFHKDKEGDLVDVHGKQISCYPDAPKVVKYLVDNGIALGAYSKSYDMEGSKQLLDMFGWKKHFSILQLHDGSKSGSFINQTNLDEFSKKAKVDLKDILFIDDIHRNINDYKRLDLICHLAAKGISMEELMKGLKKFSDAVEQDPKRI